MNRRLLRQAILAALMLLLCGGAQASSGTDIAQDVFDLRHLQPWHVSHVDSTASPDEACGIANLSGYNVLRFDLQLSPQISDRAAIARISAIDREASAFLDKRGWSVMKKAVQRRGIPDLTRCSQKRGAVVQIYQTTGRCTMNSPCKAYDGFTVVLYLPKETPVNSPPRK